RQYAGETDGIGPPADTARVAARLGAVHRPPETLPAGRRGAAERRGRASSPVPARVLAPVPPLRPGRSARDWRARSARQARTVWRAGKETPVPPAERCLARPGRAATNRS